MNYSVKYKLKHQLFWRTIKNVKGDTDQGFMNGSHVMLIKADESILILPRDGLQLEFSSTRFTLILKKMEAEAGQKLPIKS